MNCTTCGEPYTKIPTERASICSNGFHCCRDCVWSDGQVIEACTDHENSSEVKSLDWLDGQTETDFKMHFFKQDDYQQQGEVILALKPFKKIPFAKGFNQNLSKLIIYTKDHK